ncbi:MFS transporter [Nocardioides anomalus]|uniref:MFS transporter n=1 Tax=Nocardioides anomalus TaxID=2712223 RepID=A0A6G6WHL8_9ACTN|nr:MFS transporter [Nocardioides anomalus]QIG44643.1 MFS transporter [Nocardioides anomalus]
MTQAPIPVPAEGDRRLGTFPAWLVVVLIAAIGLNLRASLGSIPPLLTDMNEDLHLSNTAAGFLTSLAVVFMGISAPIGQRLGARLGAELATGLAMLLLAAAGLARLLPLGAGLLFVSVAVAGLAMGGASALMPSLVGHHLPHIRGLAMGIYSAGLAMGVAIAAGTVVPLEHLLGGWRPALASWGAIAAAAAAVWLLAVPRLRRSTAGRPVEALVVDHRMPWRSRTAWWVTLFTTNQMVVGFSGLAWVTPLYVSLGMTNQEAANRFVIFQVVQLATMLTLPPLTDYTRDRRPLLAFVLVSTSVGITMLLLDPVGLSVPAMLFFGAGVGGGSTLGLLLIVDSTRSQPDAARLGAMVFLVAFIAGAAGPVVLGLLRDLTGGFTAGYAVMLGLSVAMLALTVVYRPGRTIEDVAEPVPARVSAHR